MSLFYWIFCFWETHTIWHPSIWATISKLPCEIYNVYVDDKIVIHHALHYLMKTTKFLWHPNQCFKKKKIEEGSGEHHKVDLAFIIYSFLEICRKLPSNNSQVAKRLSSSNGKLAIDFQRQKNWWHFLQKPKLTSFCWWKKNS